MKQAVVSAVIVLLVVGGYSAASGGLYGADWPAISLVIFALGVPFALAGLVTSLLGDWLWHRAGMWPAFALPLAGLCSACVLAVGIVLWHPLVAGSLADGQEVALAFLAGWGIFLAAVAALAHWLCRCRGWQ